MISTLISGLRGFTFNGKHNRDMNVVMHSKSIQPPPKKKIKDTVPFMNGSYDFSTWGSNGEQLYSEREITIVLGLPADTKEQLQVLYSKTLEWLEDTGQQQLIFDVIPDYYYLAELEEASSFQEVMEFGLLTIKMITYPFKKSINYVGDDIWDTFNFEEDVVQYNQFTISGSSKIVIYNPGRSVNPIINCTSEMVITIGDKNFNLQIGDNNFFGLRLANGNNIIDVVGDGKIKFIFRKESI
jgi:predicted phage tail component-like protein